MAKPELIIGIDFGTTYSGVSWAINKDKPIVRLIKDWPQPMGSPTNGESHKTPTLISYHAESQRWGFNADRESVVRCFKVGLEDLQIHNDLLSILGEYSYGDADTVLYQDEASAHMGVTVDRRKRCRQLTTDYINKLWAHTDQHILKYEGRDWQQNFCIKFVIGVPAMWTLDTRASFRKLIKSLELPGELYIVSEPEAAALAVLRDRHDYGTGFKEGDILVVCDAGGGTVDLITYKILQSSPLELEEVVQGAGDLCGSAIIDAQFEQYVRTIVGEDEYFRIPKARRANMKYDFDTQIKRLFTGKDGGYVSVELRGVKDNDDVGISDERITFEMEKLRTIFDNVCTPITSLVRDQILSVRKKNKQVKAVLLVGGFGENEYLRSCIEDMAELNSGKGEEIAVLQTTDSWSSICRGATLWGLQQSLKSDSSSGKGSGVQSRICRYSLGIRIKSSHKRGSDNPYDSDSTDSSTDSPADEMVWLVKQGDRIQQGVRVDKEITEPVTVRWREFLTGHQQIYQHTLWYCSREEPPQHYDPHVVNPLCYLSHTLTRSNILRRTLRIRGIPKEVSFTLGLMMDSADMDFYVRVYGSREDAARCQTEYDRIC